ncbi:MAG TPA: SRPBCC domain-containing protein [Puia sp.]|nr:SRPBCC domain-containing protein [Puia sp.]
MDQKDYQASIAVQADAKKAFNDVCHVSDWWAKNFTGASQKLNDVFTVRFGETFVTFRLTEAVPGKKVVWLVTDCNLHWLKDKKEWRGTSVVFEFSETAGETRIRMTHRGLVPGIECFPDCKKGWDGFIKESLPNLVNMGKGMPE